MPGRAVLHDSWRLILVNSTLCLVSCVRAHFLVVLAIVWGWALPLGGGLHLWWLEVAKVWRQHNRMYALCNPFLPHSPGLAKQGLVAVAPGDQGIAAAADRRRCLQRQGFNATYMATVAPQNAGAHLLLAAPSRSRWVLRSLPGRCSAQRLVTAPEVS